MRVEIVSGSQRCPSAVRNQPLKSAHQTSFGAVAAKNGRCADAARRRSRRGGSTLAAQQIADRARRRPAIAGRSLSNFARNFFGPQCGWRRRKPTIASAMASTEHAPADAAPAGRPA